MASPAQALMQVGFAVTALMVVGAGLFGGYRILRWPALWRWLARYGGAALMYVGAAWYLVPWRDETDPDLSNAVAGGALLLAAVAVTALVRRKTP